ncbi:uncharacterized protein LOC6577391 [Drosophila mojavensis]|uniref:Uncharacterized protein n=1 Tax=Drosophila mojavensis TaxID=7230 RepID=B4KL50_DROMO|nr:uncharacterized protein LOC6577391 [Drosophila mojavensis]EDW12800.2 uncharacterized protein Dmoj_GI17871 [Drosophila mojavensis]
MDCKEDRKCSDNDIENLEATLDSNIPIETLSASIQLSDAPVIFQDEAELDPIEDFFKIGLCDDDLLQDVNFFADKETDDDTNVIRNDVNDDIPWYVEEESLGKVENSKQVETNYFGLDWDFSFGNAKSDDDIIGDFVKIDFPKPEDTSACSIYNTDMGLLKSEKLFDTSEILSLKETLSNLEEAPLEGKFCECDEPKEVDGDTPIIPDFEIDYDNVYENIAKASEMEKQLELLYRPFTCLMDVNCQFSLFELAILLDDSRYEPAHHPALFVRLHKPSAEIKIYSGGKIQSTALTANSARTALLKVIQVVEELDYKADITSFSRNIVHASFCLPFKIDLEMLSEMHSEHISGNRETRPFITYKVDGTSIRFAVFPNGYVLVLHSKQHSETRAAIAGFLPILAQFRNGYLTHSEKYGSLCGDVSFKLLWERKLEEDKEGVLLYS